MKTHFQFLLLISVWIPQFLAAQDLLWNRGMGGNNSDNSTQLILTENDELLSVGVFRDTMDLDPGVGVQNIVAPGVWGYYISKLSPTGDFMWGFGGGGSLRGSFSDIHLDGDQNIWVCGYYNGSIDIDPGPTVQLLTGHAIQPTGLLIKLSPDGQLLDYLTIPYCLFNTVEIAENGNIILGGGTRTSVDLDPDTSIVHFGSSSYSLGFVVEYSKNFDYQWCVPLLLDESGGIFDLQLDPLGNIYFGGEFDERVVDYYDGTKTYVNFTGNLGVNIFFGKITAGGTFEWVDGILGERDLKIGGLALDNLGDLLLVGTYSQDAHFNPPFGQTILQTGSFLDADPFMAKYTHEGDLLWAFGLEENLQGPANWGRGLYVDDLNNIYMSGSFSGTLDLDPGPNTSVVTGQFQNHNQFLAYYSSNGSFISGWAISSPGTSIPYNVDFDNNLNLYLSGTFTDSSDFDPGMDTALLYSHGDDDIFIAKYKVCDSIYSPDAPTFGNANSACPLEPGFWQIYSGNLNGADRWSWRIGTCDGLEIATGPGAFIPSDSSITVFVKGVGQCVVDTNCISAQLSGAPTFQTQNTDSICAGDSIWLQNKYQTIAGTYLDSLTSQQGCDSVIQTNLVLFPDYPLITNSGFFLQTLDSQLAYQWYDCPTQTPISGETNHLFTPTTDGSYQCLVSFPECDIFTGCKSFVITSTTALSPLENGSLFPNPTHSKIGINGIPKGIKPELTITDLSGRILIIKQGDFSLGNTVDVSALIPGSYFLILRDKGSRKTLSFIKMD